MNLFYLITYLLIIFNIYEAISYEISDTTVNYTEDSTYNVNYDYFDDNEDECYIDSMFDDLIEKILPDDYEEGKQLDYNRKYKHLNESIAIINRLHQYSQNVSKKFEPIMKRITSRMTESLVLIDLPPDCVSSLVRIGQSAKDGQKWALKCNVLIPIIDRIYITIKYKGFKYEGFIMVFCRFIISIQ